MKKIIIAISICTVLFLMTSCSVRPDDQNFLLKDQEIALLNENLQLKSRIAELEEEVVMLKDTQEEVVRINEGIYDFFHALKSKNAKAVHQCLAASVQMDNNGITFENGTFYDFRSNDPYINVKTMTLQQHEIDADSGTFVYEFFSEDRAQPIYNLSVEVVEQSDGWKIWNMMSNL